MKKKHDEKFIISLFAIIAVVGVVALVGLFLGMGMQGGDLAGEAGSIWAPLLSAQDCCELLDLMRTESIDLVYEFEKPAKIETWAQINAFKSRTNRVAKDLDSYLTHCSHLCEEYDSGYNTLWGWRRYALHKQLLNLQTELARFERLAGSSTITPESRYWGLNNAKDKIVETLDLISTSTAKIINDCCLNVTAPDVGTGSVGPSTGLDGDNGGPGDELEGVPKITETGVDVPLGGMDIPPADTGGIAWDPSAEGMIDQDATAGDETTGGIGTGLGE